MADAGTLHVAANQFALRPRDGLAGQEQAGQAPCPQTGAGASALPPMPAITLRSRRASPLPHEVHATDSRSASGTRRSKREPHSRHSYS